MTRRWQAAGWVCVGLAVAFAAVALVLALRTGSGPVPVGVARIDLAPAGSAFTLPGPFGPLRAIVFGVLAGVAFFTGLACFFWSAVVEARHQRAEIIRLLGER